MAQVSRYCPSLEVLLVNLVLTAALINSRRARRNKDEKE